MNKLKARAVPNPLARSFFERKCILSFGISRPPVEILFSSMDLTSSIASWDKL